MCSAFFSPIAWSPPTLKALIWGFTFDNPLMPAFSQASKMANSSGIAKTSCSFVEKYALVITYIGEMCNSNLDFPEIKMITIFSQVIRPYKILKLSKMFKNVLSVE